MNLTYPSELKRLLEKHGFSFSKSLGQNFLIDEGVLQKIVAAADLNKEICALEIGPGAGTLTQQLATYAKDVMAIEIDRALIPILSESLSEFQNVSIIHGDVMEVDLPKVTQEVFGNNPFCVVANLPYYITTPIIMELLESRLPVTSMTVMVQKEVADRMIATPGTKEYGALSVAVQYYTAPAMVCKAEPHCFIPQPKVASAVVNLKVYKEPIYQVKDEKRFFQIVKSAFGQRRKTLCNALTNSPYLSLKKEDVLAALQDMGLDVGIRGERLSVEEFVTLSNHLS